MKKVIFLMGPTASGKTKAAIDLAQRFPIDIISVDSGMVYRGMDIGTAKPSLAEQKKAPHFLIDLCDPSEAYSAAQFSNDALSQIEATFFRHRIPVLTGGTMLYFHALKYGLSPMPSANVVIRQQIMLQAEKLGWKALHDFLKTIDPVSANQIHPNDPQRISRALEVYWSTGKTRTQLWDQKIASFPFDIISIILAPSERAFLHLRIEKRFHEMLKQGFLDEVEILFQRKDLNAQLPAIRAVGYRQAWQYFLGEIGKEEMITLSIQATRQLAKRQITWLRRMTDATWLDSKDYSYCIDKLFFLVENGRSAKA